MDSASPIPGPTSLRVYVNGAGHSIPLGATALDAVRAADPTAASAVEAGERGIVDSRGLPLEPSTPAHGGAIYRLVRGRATAEG
jgi:hypothetical protein